MSFQLSSALVSVTSVTTGHATAHARSAASPACARTPQQPTLAPPASTRFRRSGVCSSSRQAQSVRASYGPSQTPVPQPSIRHDHVFTPFAKSIRLSFLRLCQAACPESTHSARWRHDGILLFSEIILCIFFSSRNETRSTTTRTSALTFFTDPSRSARAWTASRKNTRRASSQTPC